MQTRHDAPSSLPSETLYNRLYHEVRAQGWPGWGGEARLALASAQLQRIFADDRVPRTGRVLELGCGEGHLCRHLAARGFETTGVDISQVAIDWAREKSGGHSIRFLQGNLCDPQLLPAENFELVIDGNCLHCIIGEDRSRFLANVRRWLAPGGIFFVSSLGSQTEDTQILLRDKLPYRQLPSLDTLQSELEAAGFQVWGAQTHARGQTNHLNLFARPE